MHSHKNLIWRLRWYTPTLGGGGMVKLHENNQQSTCGVCVLKLNVGALCKLDICLGRVRNEKYNNKLGIKEALKTSWSTTNSIFPTYFGAIMQMEIKLNNYFLFSPPPEYFAIIDRVQINRCKLIFTL